MIIFYIFLAAISIELVFDNQSIIILTYLYKIEFLMCFATLFVENSTLKMLYPIFSIGNDYSVRFYIEMRINFPRNI